MTDTNTAEREAAEQWLRDRYGAYRGHFAWRELEEAFQAGRASLAASAGSEPVIGWHAFPHYLQHPDGRLLRTASDLLARHGYTGCAEPLRAMSDVLLSTNPSPPEGMAGWISVDERLPEVGVTVLVYEPFRHGEDWPGTVRISFDHICPDYEGWHDHCASYEHFMAVGGVNACGPDVTCVGPSEKAPYTHWQPLPAPPLPASEAKEL